jgi:hypothetical protein
VSAPAARGPDGIRPGDLVVARNRKWDGSAHWVVPGQYLGEDEHGWWIFQRTDEFISRPGAALYTESDAVLLVPRGGDYVATFFDGQHPRGVEVYVDLALEPGWAQIRPGVFEFHLVDMDLDVVRERDRGVYIDDEDEFAEHQLAMDYPLEMVARIETECTRIYEAVKDRSVPFNGMDATWFGRGRS